MVMANLLPVYLVEVWRRLFIILNKKWITFLDCKWIARHNTVRAHTEAYRIYDKELGSKEIIWTVGTAW